MLENLGDRLAGILDFLQQELVHEDLFEGGLEFDETDSDLDHLQVFLAVELLAQTHICRVEQHQSLVLLRHFSECALPSVRKDAEI